MFHTVNKFFPSKTLFDVAQIFSNFAGIIFMLSSSLSKENLRLSTFHVCFVRGVYLHSTHA